MNGQFKTANALWQYLHHSVSAILKLPTYDKVIGNLFRNFAILGAAGPPVQISQPMYDARICFLKTET
jgi:hypothetical protein